MVKVSDISRNVLKCACAFSVAASMTSVGAITQAWAQEDGGIAVAVAATVPYECNNGWSVDYSVINSKVRIDGVAAAGTGSLKIPSMINGMPVTIIGAGAFKDCTQLASIELPSTVELFKSEAFCGSGLTKISIPSSVKAISYRCFKSCTKLKEISFEGDQLLYFGQEAFMYCSALSELTVPWLTSHPIAKSNADETDTAGVEPFADSCAIGKSCFAECKALTTITFEGGVGHDTPDYFLDVSCLNGADNIKTFIWRCKMDTVGSGQAGQKVLSILESYYSLDFYNSEADAKARKNKVASAVYKPKDGTDDYNTVKTLDLLKGAADYSHYKFAGSDAIPACPSGKVWGVADNGVQGDWDTLDDSYQVIAVDRDNLDYGWVSSPGINEYRAADEVGDIPLSMYDSDLPVLYAEKDGSVPDIENGLKVYAADGSELSGPSIKLVYEQADLQLSSTGLSYNVVGWHSVNGVEGTGRYRVHAVNTANNTETPTVSFEVKDFAPDVHAYTGYSQTNMLGALSADAAVGLRSAPEYNVVVPTSDWHAQMIGAGLAGASKGVLLFDGGASASEDAYHAHLASKSSSVQIVGSTSLVPQSTKISSAKYLSDWLLSNVSGDQTRYKNDSTPQKLSAQVYSTMTQGFWDSTWGKTAVIMPSTKAQKLLPVAQLVYKEKAPVFFADSKGNLSSVDLAALQSGGFERVVIAGDESDVTAACASSVAERAGVTPERVLDSGASAYENSVAFAEQQMASGNSFDFVAVADGTVAANVVLAAQVAAQNNGIVLVCNSARDVKAAQAYLGNVLATQGSTTIKSLYMVGTFAQVDSKAQSRIESIWSTPTSTAIAVSDSFEVNGNVYVATGASSAKLLRWGDSSGSSASVNTVSFGGKTYKVTAVGKDAFGSNMTSIALGNNVATVAAGAFASCTKLTSLSLGTGVKKIANSTFSSCAKVKTLTIKSTKLKSSALGSKAFKGLPTKLTVKVPKSKLKTYKKLFVKKGLSKKATVKKI